MPLFVGYSFLISCLQIPNFCSFSIVSCYGFSWRMLGPSVTLALFSFICLLAETHQIQNLGYIPFFFFLLRWNIWHKINYFKVSNSVTFSPHTELYNYFSVVPKHFHFPTSEPVSIKQSLSFPVLPAPGNHPSVFCLYGLTSLRYII